MFLKSLTIESEDFTIREIFFHKGINFIVDETKPLDSSDKKSGNNIGKTTVLRLINFCLGGKGESIYQSKEFKNNFNEEAKRFLTEKGVVITLKLRDDLDDPLSRQIEIRRNFLSHSKKILEINEKPVKVKDFDGELKKLIFGYEEDKPTFKQLKAKNIRDEAERLENTVKVLGDYGKSEEYEALYLFWLGVNYPDADKKRSLLEDKKLEDKLYSRLVSDNSESMIQQFLKIVERDIKELENKKNNFNINETYEIDLKSLNEVRADLNSLYTEQSQLNLRKGLIEESRTELERDIANEEISQLAEFYAQAKATIPGLQKNYEDIVAFHNQMISEKIHYVTEELPGLKDKLIKNVSTIQLKLSKEKNLVEALQKTDAIDELQIIISELNGMYEKKGRLEEKSEQLQTTQKNLENIGEKLSAIDKSIFSLDKVIQERVSTFNGFFSDISNRLYGEKFAI